MIKSRPSASIAQCPNKRHHSKQQIQVRQNMRSNTQNWDTFLNNSMKTATHSYSYVQIQTVSFLFMSPFPWILSHKATKFFNKSHNGHSLSFIHHLYYSENEPFQTIPFVKMIWYCHNLLKTLVSLMQCK